MKSLVAIIVLNWNGLEVTKDCLNSLKKITYSNYRIILVDNNSSPPLNLEAFKNNSRLKLINLDSNKGFAEANNIGIQYAKRNFKPDYFLFLNNDTVVDERFLDKLVSFAEKNPKIGIVGPKIYYWKEKDKIWFCGGKIDFEKGPFIHLHQLEKDSKSNSISLQVDYINGCCMLVKNSVIQGIGGWDKEYFAYVEDIDFNIRAKARGYESWIVPSAKIWHKVSYTTGGDANFKKEYLKSRNLIFFWKKNNQKLKKLTLRNILKIKSKEIVQLIIRLDFKRAFYISLGIFSGISKC